MHPNESFNPFCGHQENGTNELGKFLSSSVDPLRSPQFAGGSISDQHVELSAEAIHIAASKGNLDIVKDLLATWKGKLMGVFGVFGAVFALGTRRHQKS